jgi:ABC-2 type transport system permease protein
MPIFDQGYQHWQGELSGHAWRWLTITSQGVRTGLRSRWVRLASLAALVPALSLAAFLLLWGLAEQRVNQGILQNIGLLPPGIQNAPKEFRVPIWTLAYHYFFSHAQLYFCMFLVLLVGPSLISQDLRFNAIPLYFSRPLRRFDYFVGKLGVIGVFLGSVAILPAVIAYALGVAFSLDFSVVKDTIWILGASIVYGLVIVLSAGTLMLAISSLSRNSRYVGFTWVGLCIISFVVAQILVDTVRKDWCPAVSYVANLRRVGDTLLQTDWAFARIQESLRGVMPNAGGAPMPPMAKGRPTPTPPQPPRPTGAPSQREEPTPPWYLSAGILAGLFGLSLWTLTFRVRSLDRLR